MKRKGRDTVFFRPSVSAHDPLDPREAEMKKISVQKSIPFFIVHLIALIGAILYPPTWGLIALCAFFYFLRMFGVTGGYHRYFSHRTYKTSRLFQFALAWLAQSSAQKGALWWAAHHRHHHKHSDEEVDLHSPVQDGFWWSHVGWILSERYDETEWSQISDLKKFPELVWLNRYHLVPAVALGVGVFLFGGMPALVWGFLVSTVLCWHGTFTINSLSHVFGSRRYTTTDASRNNWLLAFVTMGEGWHNNHHAYQSSTNQGFFWWEYDFTYYILKAFNTVGLVWDLRKPPLQLLESKRLDRGAIDEMPGLESLKPLKETA